MVEPRDDLKESKKCSHPSDGQARNTRTDHCYLHRPGLGRNVWNEEKKTVEWETRRHEGSSGNRVLQGLSE